MGGNSYALDLSSKGLYAFDERLFSLRVLPHNPAFERSKSLRFYGVGDATWVAGTLPGAFHFNQALESAQESTFKDVQMRAGGVLESARLRLKLLGLSEKQAKNQIFSVTAKGIRS